MNQLNSINSISESKIVLSEFNNKLIETVESSEFILFLELYYPDYSTCEYVLKLDLYSRFLRNELDSQSGDYAYINGQCGGNIDICVRLYLGLSWRLYYLALSNYSYFLA